MSETDPKCSLEAKKSISHGKDKSFILIFGCSQVDADQPLMYQKMAQNRVMRGYYSLPLLTFANLAKFSRINGQKGPLKAIKSISYGIDKNFSHLDAHTLTEISG